jgi:hypothetical protein
MFGKAANSLRGGGSRWGRKLCSDHCGVIGAPETQIEVGECESPINLKEKACRQGSPWKG